MAIKILGINTQEQFERNTNRFQFCDELNVYKQTLNPMINYVDNIDRSHEIQDTFAVDMGNGNYTIFIYEGSNFLEHVQREIQEFRMHPIG